jgi:cell wall-associated NlpC family hydrolase
MSRRTTVVLAAFALLTALPAGARAADTGGMAYGAPAGKKVRKAQAPAAGPTQPATIGADGLATAPPDAPAVIVRVIEAANRIATTPYRFGGGHGSFDDTGYDCSGSLSYALHGGGLLDATLDSTGLAQWGKAGPGAWITVYAHKTHAFMLVAGLRFDTSGRAKGGTRWQAAPRSTRGFSVRHPAGL